MAIAPGEFDPDKTGLPNNEFGEGPGLISSGQGGGGGAPALWSGWSPPSIGGGGGAEIGGGFIGNAPFPDGLRNKGVIAGAIAGAIPLIVNSISGGPEESSRSSTSSGDPAIPDPIAGTSGSFKGSPGPPPLEGTPQWMPVKGRGKQNPWNNMKYYK